MGPQGMALATASTRILSREKIGTSTLPHETNRSSDARLIRRAVSTLVHATPLHPAQRHLPMTMHPP